LKQLFTDLSNLLNNFVSQFDNKRLLVFKYIFLCIFALSFMYIYFGLNYTFIPYPTAWDANHAYMFLPKVFAEYNGYPWNIDFRP